MPLIAVQWNRALTSAEADGTISDPRDPPHFMNAAVLTIGTELLRGEVVDQNGSWLIGRLGALGLEVVEQRCIGDELGAIRLALMELASVADIVLVTGGLGSTSDDLTRDAAALALGEELEPRAEALDRIVARWRDLGREMPEINRRQAMVPVSARLLDNPVGSAPGFAFELTSASVYCVPGVPVEARAIFDETIAAELAPKILRKKALRCMRVAGLAESEVASRIEALEALRGTTLRYSAQLGEVVVSIEAEASDEGAAFTHCEAAAEVIGRRLGDYVYAEGEESLPAVVGQHLRDRGLTLAIAESCTGGAVGTLLTDVPGSSAFLLLDAVVYANSAKEKILGVRNETLRGHGAVSPEVAAAMAEGALRVAESDLALSITGIAGPTGGTDAKPVGTVFFAIARRDAPTTVRYAFLPGDRDRVRGYAASLGLDLLRRAALGLPLVNAYLTEITS